MTCTAGTQRSQPGAAELINDPELQKSAWRTRTAAAKENSHTAGVVVAAVCTSGWFDTALFNTRLKVQQIRVEVSQERVVKLNYTMRSCITMDTVHTSHRSVWEQYVDGAEDSSYTDSCYRA
jgi:hypothetical protein